MESERYKEGKSVIEKAYVKKKIMCNLNFNEKINGHQSESNTSQSTATATQRSRT